LVVCSVLLLNLLLIALLFKEFRLSSFDPELATTVGIDANLMHYLLMTMVAVTTVAAFESVGSIIVIAMLIVPPATAYLLTSRLLAMLLLSVAIGVAAAVLGHLGALAVPGWLGLRATVSSGMMAAAAGLLFGLAWLLSPREGLLPAALRRRGPACSSAPREAGGEGAAG
jgi:manganese/zinc/iron transport system permease protein